MAASSRKLLESISRSANNAAVPISAYEDDALRDLVAESNALYQDIVELMQGGEAELTELTDGVKAALVVHHQMILRHKRVALHYLQHRIETLSRLRWQAGLVLPEEIRANMSPHERTFYKEYDDLFTDFSRYIKLDLTAGTRPPKDLFIEVRASVDCGQVATEHSGIITLDQGTSHFLRASDVEHLIHQGMLEHIV